MEIWTACQAEVTLRPLDGILLRMVESQEQVATTALVDDLTEQALLERMLERTKPAPRPGTGRLHYLLATPWRYPPLRHGSRYGRRSEPSLFYGSLSLTTLLAEVAYYRLLFRAGMVQPATAIYRTQHTQFSASYRTEQGLSLQRPPFDRYRDWLISPGDYSATQPLGSRLREAQVMAFEYPSARDRAGGLNIALFEPGALAVERPLEQEEWLCETSDQQVLFRSRSQPQPIIHHRDAFTVAGVLPAPAS